MVSDMSTGGLAFRVVKCDKTHPAWHHRRSCYPSEEPDIPFRTWVKERIGHVKGGGGEQACLDSRAVFGLFVRKLAIDGAFYLTSLLQDLEGEAVGL